MDLLEDVSADVNADMARYDAARAGIGIGVEAVEVLSTRCPPSSIINAQPDTPAGGMDLPIPIIVEKDTHNAQKDAAGNKVSLHNTSKRKVLGSKLSRSHKVKKSPGRKASPSLKEKPAQDTSATAEVNDDKAPPGS